MIPIPNDLAAGGLEFMTLDTLQDVLLDPKFTSAVDCYFVSPGTSRILARICMSTASYLKQDYSRSAYIMGVPVKECLYMRDGLIVIMQGVTVVGVIDLRIPTP